MAKYLIHSIQTFDLLKVVEADSAEQAEQKAKTFVYDEFQKDSGEVTQSISEVPDDYNIGEDARSKGYV